MVLRRGRPSLCGMPMPRIALGITPVQRKQLTKMALRRHDTVSGVVREAIDDLIDRDARDDDDQDDP